MNHSLSTSEDHAWKVPHNRKKVQTPTKVRVKVEPNASMSAPAAIGKNKKRTSAWNKGSIEHGAIRLFHEDDSLCDDMYQTKLYIDEKKVSMPRKLTVVERKKLNCGLCEHLRAHAYWLKLNATSATEERNRWNSSSLRAIASMIETQAEETLKPKENGDYSYLPNVGKAFSKVIHAYFLAKREEEI